MWSVVSRFKDTDQYWSKGQNPAVYILRGTGYLQRADIVAVAFPPASIFPPGSSLRTAHLSSTMMPVVPTAKRSHGFTIDSLMSKDTPSSHLRDSRPPPSGPQPQMPRSPRSPRSRSSPDVVPTRPSSSGRAPTPSSRGPASSTPINLTASAEAATVPLRDGLFGGGGGGGNNGGGHMGGGLPSSFHPVHSNAALLNSMKSLYAHEHAAAYPDGLAAAAALGFPVPLAATTAHGLPGGFSPAGHPGFTGGHPLLLGHHREHFNLYPWLMSRHGGYFGHGRFPGPDATHLLLQPFRKPKRIRTAFSPSQLLRLEHAFEKNHYVVGQERKDLAINLSLTETQVKVWFQNRRTKYKRMKAEESEGGSGGGREPRSPGSPRSDGRPDHDDDDDSDMPLDVSSNPGEDEELDMVDEEDEEIIDCVTSPEEEEREAMGDSRMLMMSSSLMRDNVMSSSMVNSMSSSGILSRSSNNHDPRLLQHSPSPPLPPQPSHHPMEQLTAARNDSLPIHKGQGSSRLSPPRSPSPTSAKTAHHVERWRSETNQAQAV